MDLFARTFLPAAANAGMSMPRIARHIPLVRRCLGTEDAVLRVARCARPGRPLAGEHVLVLTRHRLVVTRAPWFARRARLHLDAPIHELADVAWRADPASASVELAATAVDGIRERFLIKVRLPRTAWLFEETFGYVFRGVPVGERGGDTARPAATERPTDPPTPAVEDREAPTAAPAPVNAPEPAADLASVHSPNVVRTPR